MRIFLLNPPFHPRFSRSQRSPGVTKSGTFYYPMWLAYAAGVLEAHGHQVCLLDAPAEGMDRTATLARISAFKPELVVLDTSTPSIANDLEIAAAIKLSRQTKLVLVGTHVTALAESLLQQHPIDFIARREYEYTLLELANALDSKSALDSVLGLSFRDERGVFSTPDRPYLQDLDQIPWVSKAYKKYLPYRSYNYSITRHPILALITARGCPFHCHFCLYPQTFTGHQYRVRSVEDVVAELRFIKTEFPEVREIFFEDDTFTVDKKRVKNFCDQLIKAKLNLTWTANARSDLDLDLLQHMKAAGLRLLCVGFESVDPQVRKSMGKGVELDRTQQFVKNARRAKVLIHGCFIYGNPGDTPETFSATMRFAKQMPLSSAQFFPIMPYPGTLLYAELKRKGFLATEAFPQWVDEKGFHNCVVNYPHLSGEEIMRACNWAKMAYHFRPRYFLHKAVESIRQPEEFLRNLQSLLTLLKNSARSGFFNKTRSSSLKK